MKKKSGFLSTAVVSAFLAGSVFGQEPAPPPPREPVPAKQGEAAAQGSPCPRIEVAGQKSVREGQPAIFTANLAGGDPKVTPQIMWQVNSGAITAGQQSRKIEVDTAGAGIYRELTAEVWVGGYPGECQVQASSTVRVIPPAVKMDEFGDLAAEQENERLAAALGAISQSDDKLFVIGYAGRTSPRGHSAASLTRMKNRLIGEGLADNRVSFIDGGFREQAAFEIWVVPQGAEAPKPAPTVDRREIVYPKKPAPVRKPAKP